MSNDSKTTQRDELQAVIYGYFGPPSQIKPYKKSPVEQDRELAETILAAGYRKPRTVTTVEELDALPDGSIVMADWATHQRVLGQWATFGSPATSQPDLPATVLHEPEAEATR